MLPNTSHQQRGYVVPMILFGVVALLSGIGLLLYFSFYKKPVAVNPTLVPTPIASVNEVEITDFESCEKAGYPVQESYPRVCRADGKSFTELITATPSPSTSGNVSLSEGWKLYVSSKDGYSIIYPTYLFTNCSRAEGEFYLFEGAEGTRECNLGEEPTMFYITTMENSKHYQTSNYEQCYTVTKEPIMVGGIQGFKYYADVKSKTGDCGLTEVAYADIGTHIDLSRQGKNYEIYYHNDLDEKVIEEMLISFKFNN